MPRNFGWLIDNEIAGMGRPAASVADFEFLKDRGIDAIVSLTMSPLNQMILEEFGFRYKHIPVADFTAPTVDQIKEFAAFAEEVKGEGKKMVVHCGAGIGRTGTMLACYLVRQGRGADEAIAEVRERRPGSIETVGQELMILAYARIISEGDSSTDAD